MAVNESLILSQAESRPPPTVLFSHAGGAFVCQAGPVLRPADRRRPFVPRLRARRAPGAHWPRRGLSQGPRATSQPAGVSRALAPSSFALPSTTRPHSQDGLCLFLRGNGCQKVIDILVSSVQAKRRNVNLTLFVEALQTNSPKASFGAQMRARALSLRNSWNVWLLRRGGVSWLSVPASQSRGSGFKITAQNLSCVELAWSRNRTGVGIAVDVPSASYPPLRIDECLNWYIL